MVFLILNYERFDYEQLIIQKYGEEITFHTLFGIFYYTIIHAGNENNRRQTADGRRQTADGRRQHITILLMIAILSAACYLPSAFLYISSSS